MPSPRPRLAVLPNLLLVVGLVVGLLAGLVAGPQAASATPAPQPEPSATAMVGPGKVDLHQPSAPASGFWTSRTPAKGGAYKYTLLLIGTGVVLLTAGLLVIGLRRVGRQRGA